MKTNRQARLLLLNTSDGYEHAINISNHKRQYSSNCGSYCVTRKQNIGQARWARYRRWVNSLESE